MKNITIAVFIIMVFNNCIVDAQVTQEWVATYSGTGTGYNFPKKSTIDKSGNFIVGGNSDSTGGYDYVVLKYAPSGNLIWKQRYNGIGNGYDYLIGMVLDDSGNVYVTGGSDEGIAAGKVNWVTIKFNSNGALMWKRSLNWTANDVDEPFGMNIDKERNIYVVGFGRVTSLERALVTIKYSSNGDSIWTKSYTSLPNRSNWGYSVSIDDSLNVYSSGYGALPLGNEIVTIKYDTKGNERWVKKYPTNSGDYLRPTFSGVDRENNIIVVGNSYYSNNYDFVTLKYSSGGDLIWKRYFAGANDDYAKSLFLDSDNNILIGGSAYSIGFSDFLILKYSPIGDTLLIKLIEGGALNSDQVECIVSDKTNNIYVTGFSQSLSGVEHYLTVKLNSSGDTLWSKTYRNVYSNSAYCLNIDYAGNVYVSGVGGLPGGNSAITTVKYSQTTSIQSDEILSRDTFVINNYPNPFNSSTVIIYNIKSSGYVVLKIFDVLGNEIKTLISKIQNTGNHKIIFDGTNLTSGIYFYSLFFNKNLVKTNRMLLIK